MINYPLPEYHNLFATGFEAQGQIKRSDFGMNAFIGPVGDIITLNIHFDLIKCEGDAVQAPPCQKQKEPLIKDTGMVRELYNN